jgi:hypothetical protein
MNSMLLHRFLQTRRLWLVALLASVLVAVQLVQASPLHEHSSHSIDCGLCHLPAVDDPRAQQAPVAAISDLPVQLLHSAALCFSSHCSVPYQGRAPPAVSP